MCPSLLLAVGLQEMEAAAARSSLPVTPTGQLDFSQDFFGEKVYLTVSGQLNGESVTQAQFVSAWPACLIMCHQALGVHSLNRYLCCLLNGSHSKEIGTHTSQT